MLARGSAPPEAASEIVAMGARLRQVPLRLGRILEARLGVTLMQAQNLAEVAAGATRLRDLAERTGQRPSSASRTVDSLVEAGLLRRGLDPEDRRSLHLEITDRGIETVGAVERISVGLNRQILAIMDETQARALVPALQAYLDAADEVLTDATAPTAG